MTRSRDTASIIPTVDAKGDLLVGTADNTIDNLSPGTNGQVLTANSATATGLEWTTPASTGNVIINGAFDIWQRGTSFSNPSVGTYAADRWRRSQNGSGGTSLVTRENFLPGELTVPSYGSPQYFLRFNESVAPTGQTFNAYTQRIEDVRTLAGQTVTFSIWARSESPTSLTVQLQQNFGSGGSSQVATTLTGFGTLGTTWQRYSGTISLPPVSDKTIGSDSFLSATLFFTNNSVKTVDIWGVQLEAGSVATPFKRNANSLQGELAACQRYYVRWTGQSATSVGAGLSTSATEGYASIQYPVQMRVKPTSVDFSSLVFSDNATYDRAVSSIGIELAGPLSINIGVNFASGASTYRPGMLKISGSGFLGLSAEL
jgi:hypothetical protein